MSVFVLISSLLFVGNCFKEIIYLPEGIFKELLMLITFQLKKMPDKETVNNK